MDDRFPIVGLGASAGGLEAYTELLTHLPPDTGFGFVLIQHLDPKHDSALPQLLARATSMPVLQARNDLRVRANHVYIIPPNSNLAIEQRVLKLVPRTELRRMPHHPIDVFFQSLAQDQHDRSIGVVLSGTANDGTLGLETIKGAGGITFAQDESARYNSMPQSAVAAGCVDFVLNPAGIAKELSRISRHPYVLEKDGVRAVRAGIQRASGTARAGEKATLPPGRRPPGAEQMRAEAEAPADEPRQDAQRRILSLLHKHSGVDFSLYKSPTIHRRVMRRAVLSQTNSFEDYANSLRGNVKELDALYFDLLISVTGFFRNADAFETLKRKVFPALLRDRAADDPLRAWVVGCSTGQEAYSIAMTFVECTDDLVRAPRLQIFATDLNDALLDRARSGLFAKGLTQEISQARLRRFFFKDQGGYRIAKSIRDMIVFARQNLISDPPFSRLDLVTCRNLLIYLEPSVQRNAIPTFHYALNPGGFLFLGASESVGGFSDLFEPVDKKHKIYIKKPTATAMQYVLTRPTAEKYDKHDRPRTQLSQPRSLVGVRNELHSPDDFGAELDVQREADRVIVNRFAPPAVLVNAELQVLQFRGQTGAYLEPPSGRASFDVLKMARGGLMLPLRAAILKAKKSNRPVRSLDVPMHGKGQQRRVNVEVIPLKNLRDGSFLILFEDVPAPGAASRDRPADTPTLQRPSSRLEQTRHVAELERELVELRDYMQSTQEQHEAGAEELQAANEEVTSANEELQSLNEELESSKEELESTNEELTTLNEEMVHRNAELSRANSDLLNLQGSTKLAIIVLGPDLTIRRLTPEAEKSFNLLPTDVGRPLGNVRHNLVSSDLEAIATKVIANVRESEHEVQDKDGHWFSLRVRPYLTIDKKVDGAVMVLVDIDSLKRTERGLLAARDFAENTIETVREPLVRLDAQLRIQMVNRAFYRMFGTTSDETIGQYIHELGNRQWDSPRLRQLLENVLLKETVIEDFEVDQKFPQIGRRIMLLNARRLQQQPQEDMHILLAIEDITERKRSQQQQQVLIAELKHRTRNLLAVVSAISAQTIANSRSLEDFALQFDDRLSALSRVQGYLASQETNPTAIADIVHGELKAIGSSDVDDRVRIEGEDVGLPRHSVQIIALALHELATNAVKYGALAGKGGRLHVKWRVRRMKGDDDAYLVLEWTETGVEVAASGATTRGYGRELIEDALPYQLGARSSFKILPDGVRCSIEIPLTQALREKSDGQ